MTASMIHGTVTQSHPRYVDEDEGIDVELPTVIEDDADVYFDKEKGLIRFATHDSDPMAHEFPEGVEFIQGNPATQHYHPDPVSWQLTERDGMLPKVFTVGVYEHGLVQYTLSGESVHANDQWDYCVGALIRIPDEYTNPTQAARDILREYTDWCNGNVWVVWEVDVTTGGYDCCGGYIGTESVEDALANGF